MEFYKLRAKYLKYYWKYHTSPPTLLSMLPRAVVVWILFVVLLVGAYFLASLVIDDPTYQFGLLGLSAGVMFGVVLRDIGIMRLTEQIWPILEEIIDWEAVEEKHDALNEQQ